jgi:integrase/recombinase XerD
LPAKLITTIKNIEIRVENETNRQLIKEFHEYLTSIDTSKNYQNGLIKVIRFAQHLFILSKTNFCLTRSRVISH